jgi:hypothetical protein
MVFYPHAGLSPLRDCDPDTTDLPARLQPSSTDSHAGTSKKTFGLDHSKCKSLCNKLAPLVNEEEEQSSFAKTRLIEDFSKESVGKSVTSFTKPASYRHRLVARLWQK